MATKTLKISKEAVKAVVHMWWMEHGKGEAKHLDLFRTGSERAFAGVMKSLVDGKGLREKNAREVEEGVFSHLISNPGMDWDEGVRKAVDELATWERSNGEVFPSYTSTLLRVPEKFRAHEGVENFLNRLCQIHGRTSEQVKAEKDETLARRREQRLEERRKFDDMVKSFNLDEFVLSFLAKTEPKTR